MKHILTLAFCAISCYFFSQTYAYSFQGNLTIEQQNLIIKKILDLPLVSNCELKYKTDSQRGEIILFVTKNESRSESSIEFSPVEIKSLFIEQDLDPLEFRMIK